MEHEQDSDESDSYVIEIRKWRKKPRKRIFYEEEVDGVSDQEPDSPPSEEGEDINIKPEIKIKSQLKTNKQPKKKIKKQLLNQ